MSEDKLENRSITKIQVNTNFKPQIQDGEDLKTDVIRAFHNAVHCWIDQQITDNEDFEQKILEIMNDELEKGSKEFSDLGSISIQVWQEEFEVKQHNLSDDEIEVIQALPTGQTRLKV